MLDETRDPISFITECLRNPQTRRPFELLPAEIEFLKHAFEIGDDGRLQHAELIFAAIKKIGKTTFAALFLLPMLLLFGGRFAESYIFGEAYIVANDSEQAQSRVFEAVRRIVMASALLRKEAKIVTVRISFPALDASITALASHFESAAGAHPTTVTSEWGYRL